jgi:hypothetical protein
MILNEEQKKIINLNKEANEIEIRTKLEAGRIQEILKKLDPAETVDSITLVYEAGTGVQMRRESFYADGKKIRSEDLKKIKMGIVKVGVFAVSFAQEVAIDNFDSKLTEAIRFKSRYSFKILGAKLDITRYLDIGPRTPKILVNFANFLTDTGAGNWDIELELKNANNIEAKIVEFSEFLGINDVVQNQLREIANILGLPPHIATVKQIGRNPVMLDRAVFERMKLENFVILEKSDGLRVLVKYMDKKNYIIFADGKTHMEGAVAEFKYLLDCEWMENGTVKVFDLILAAGKVGPANYEDRMEMVKKMDLPANFEVKKYLAATCENMKYLVKNSRGADGIIFNEIENSYAQMDIFKWKPAEQITFDFLAIKVPDEYKGVKPFVGDGDIWALMSGCSIKQAKRAGVKLFPHYKDLLLRNGIVLADYNPVPFSPDIWRDAYVWYSTDLSVENDPSINVLMENNMFVGEFRKIGGHWDLIRVREDKTMLIPKRIYGNDFFVARKHLMELQNPLTVEDICSGKAGGAGYFAVEKGAEYEDMTKFNGFVKYEVLQYLCGCGTVLDIGSGRGQDVFKYPPVEHITFLEPDTAAFTELNKRLEKVKYAHNTVNDSYENFIAEKRKFDAVVSNFACHYFLTEQKKYIEFAKYCRGVGAKNIILTFMNIDVMKSVLPLKNKKYEVLEKDGKLWVKHHFGTELYPESIIKTEKLIEALKKEKYILMVRDSFANFLDMRDLKDPLDRQYVGFYQYLIFRALS